MIHNSSKDPVRVKKIDLKIWSLRDEIESKIQEKVEQGVSPEDASFQELKSIYTKTQTNNIGNVVALKEEAELDNSEDEMLRAMQGEDIPDESSTETAAEATTEVQDANIISISLEAPKIPPEKIARGKTILAEITMDKMFFFCNHLYIEGQSVVIQFCIPKSFIVNADVIICRPFNIKSRIISQNNYKYRVMVKFNFLKEGERALLRQFIQSIEVELPKAVEAPAESNDDLDDFGL